jgi:metal-sulfur cluster biosynthetic enzyme
MSDVLWQALRDVQVPQLGQSVVDLGLVVDVSLKPDGSAVVDLILPSSHWPWADELLEAVEAALLAQPAVLTAQASIVPEPLWTPYRMIDLLKADLGLPRQEPPPLSEPGRSTASRLRRALGRWLPD